MGEKSNYQIEIDEFKANFAPYKDKRILLYGIGRYTATLLPGIKDFNIIGLMDRDSGNIGKNMYGFPIISNEDAEKNADMIIINTAGTYWKTIYKRICTLSIPVYYLNGKLAVEEQENQDYKDNPYWKQSYLSLKDNIDKHEVISFDIFDTLIMRKVFAVQDIFKLVESRVYHKLGLKVNFYEARMQAGIMCNDENMTLNDIYAELNREWMLSEEILQQIKNVEIQVEQECCVPRAKMIELYNEVSLHNEVYLISDMYLPCEIIANILIQCGVKNTQNIWISAEKCGNKKSGELWKLFCKTVVKGRKALHIGDNAISDVEIPKQYGIDTYYIMSATEMWQKSSLREFVDGVQTIEESIFAGLIGIKLFNDPFALNKYSGKIVFEDFFTLGYCIWGPIIYSFLAWLLEQAKKNKRERLVFFARDGYFLQKDYKYLIEVGKVEHAPLDCYLPISRRLVLISSFEKEEDFDNLLAFPYNGTFKDYLLDRFDLDVFEGDKHADMHMTMPQDLEIVKTWIVPYKKKTIKQIELERKNYISYIEKMHINSTDGVVDLWYYGNNQYYLSKIVNKTLTGFYFAVNKAKDNKCCENNVLIPCFQKESDPYAQQCNLRKEGVWTESFLTAPYGMIKAVDESGNYLCASTGMNQKTFDKRELMNNGVCAFMKDYVDIFGRIQMLEPGRVDNYFGEYVNGNMGLSQVISEVFYYDNVSVQRRESKIFE